jgi:hypothetical protein
MAKTRFRHHHELPRYYLQAFGEPFTSFIWVFERGGAYSPGTKYGNNPRKRGLNDAGLRPDGYAAFTRSGKRHFAYEQALQAQEHLADDVIRRARAFETVTTEDKSALARYIALMWRRVSAQDPVMKSMVDRHFDTRSLRMAARKYADAGMFYDARKLGEEAEWYQTDHGNIEMQRDLVLSSFDQFCGVLLGLRWEFYRTREPHYFITTDVPVAYDREVGVRRSPLHFPLSRSVLLVATSSGHADLVWRQADAAAVEAFNRTILSHAANLAYASAPDEWIQRAFKGRENNCTVGDA